jgi:hypothetical protein
VVFLPIYLFEELSVFGLGVVVGYETDVSLNSVYLPLGFTLLHLPGCLILPGKPLRPSEFSVLLLDHWCYHRWPSSWEIGCSFRVSRPLQYRPYRLGAPTLPLAVSSALWSSSNGLRWSQLSDQSSPLREFHLSLESYPAKPSRSAAANQLLSWASVPYSTPRIKGPLIAGFACPLRSAFRVWLPS